MENKRSIQFRRNLSKLYASKEEVINAMNSRKEAYTDGEQILGRYLYTDPETFITKVITLVGYVYSNDNTSTIDITYSDAFNLEKEVESIESKISKSLYWGTF